MNCRTTIRYRRQQPGCMPGTAGRTDCLVGGTRMLQSNATDWNKDPGMADNTTSLADRAGAPIERPLPLPSGNALFGSDVVAETLRALEVPFIALNPGSSYRGLHDSLVNYLGNVQPQMLLCLHEEHAVAIAHGYAKVTGRPMAAAVHSNVGLMHATMAVFNAWCDRMPVLLLGATGPVDAPKRRPWIDWIHTARDQGALIRRLHQVGRSARLGRGGAGVAAARVLAGQFGAQGTSLHQSRRRHAGGTDRRSAAADRCVPVCARRGVGCGAGAGGTRGGDAARGEAAGDPDGARLARRTGMGQPRGVGGDAARPRDDRSEVCRGISHRSSAACRRAGDISGAGGGAGHRRRRCHPEPRLGRSGGSTEGSVRHGLAGGEGDRSHAGSSASQWLEHGPSGAAARRSVHCRRRRTVVAALLAQLPRQACHPQARASAAARPMRRPSPARSAWRR